MGVVSVDDLANADTRRNPVESALIQGDLGEALSVLRSKRMENTPKSGGMSIVDVIPWVDRAVLYAFAKGVGAKTNLGYSRFEVQEYRTI